MNLKTLIISLLNVFCNVSFPRNEDLLPKPIKEHLKVKDGHFIISSRQNYEFVIMSETLMEVLWSYREKSIL